MNHNIPPLLITSDYKELFAYLVQRDGVAETLAHIDFQADGPTSAPLLDWSPGQNSYEKLAGLIGAFLQRYRPESWGIACPQGLFDGLWEHLEPEHQASLAKRRCVDVSDLTVSKVTAAFGGESSPPCAEIPCRPSASVN